MFSVDELDSTKMPSKPLPPSDAGQVYTSH
ncbi:unnamed protein product [Cuscuta europaea]|uniref:Uncharacterized protein n=1 Tax=Cuscuta europaea TaxID=41803 RepID=A0A9P0ZRY5_CUSEU|nr:unnamed protein product [Cuscuta europaea]